MTLYQCTAAMFSTVFTSVKNRIMLGWFYICLLWKFKVYNRKYFSGELTNPAILLKTPETKGYAGYDSADKKIRIEPNVITGDDKEIKKEAPLEGRGRFIFDCLLHEMIHKYCVESLEVEKKKEPKHGPTFKEECNRIAEIWVWDMTEYKEKEYDAFPFRFRPPEDFYMGASLQFSDEENEKWRKKPPVTNEPPLTAPDIISYMYKGNDDKG